jgi:hypothetical protein
MGLQGTLWDETVLERIVIGLRRTALPTAICCWKNRRKKSAVPGDELGNVARAELVNDTGADMRAHWGDGATRVDQLRTSHRRKRPMPPRVS